MQFSRFATGPRLTMLCTLSFVHRETMRLTLADCKNLALKTVLALSASQYLSDVCLLSQSVGSLRDVACVRYPGVSSWAAHTLSLLQCLDAGTHDYPVYACDGVSTLPIYSSDYCIRLIVEVDA